MKKLPIGLSDFKELIQENYYFVDKSLLIKDLLEEGAKALLVPRPRRFGKTLNMSMLQYFFEKAPESNRNLFSHLKISQHSESMIHQGQYPVIFLTFKDAKKLTWDGCLEKIKNVLSGEFRRHKYLLESSELDAQQKNSFQAIIDCSASQGVIENSLKDLTTYLHAYHGKRPIILIDEYDAPIQAGFMNGYYKEIINFMREMLSEGLKDNQNLHFAVMTGILRVAKESIFSGLNNLKICSLINNAYSDKFGLLEDEVRDLMDHVGLVHNLDDIKAWYNGYASGDDHTVYNPWSVLNYVDNDGKFAPYWINTSENVLIKELIEKGSTDLKLDVEQLLAGNAIEKYVNDNIFLDNVFSQTDVVWSFLLFAGYLSFNRICSRNGLIFCSLRIPNLEVRAFYKLVIFELLKSDMRTKSTESRELFFRHNNV
ncbi:AAA family ATPase [Candidatus Babeliales bacterium]|nr:AAA family ATPase [Candidatus Babeliales bacterium]